MNDSIYTGSKPDKTKLMILKVRILFTYRKQGVEGDGEVQRASNFWSGCVHFHQAYYLCAFLYNAVFKDLKSE